MQGVYDQDRHLHTTQAIKNGRHNLGFNHRTVLSALRDNKIPRKPEKLTDTMDTSTKKRNQQEGAGDPKQQLTKTRLYKDITGPGFHKTGTAAKINQAQITRARKKATSPTTK